MEHEHNEPCKTLVCVCERLSKLEAEESRTHDWVKDLSNEIHKLREDIQDLKITVGKYLGVGIGAWAIISILIDVFVKK